MSCRTTATKPQAVTGNYAMSPVTPERTVPGHLSNRADVLRRQPGCIARSAGVRIWVSELPHSQPFPRRLIRVEGRVEKIAEMEGWQMHRIAEFRDKIPDSLPDAGEALPSAIDTATQELFLTNAFRHRAGTPIMLRFRRQ